MLIITIEFINKDKMVKKFCSMRCLGTGKDENARYGLEKNLTIVIQQTK